VDDALPHCSDNLGQLHRQFFRTFNRWPGGPRSYPQPRRKQAVSSASAAPTAEQLHSKRTALLAKYSPEERKGTSSTVKDETPFNVACASGHLDAVKVLDGAGARRNVMSSCGMSALHLAAAHGAAAVVEYLLSKPDVDKELQAFDLNTALHFACAAGSVDTVKVMRSRLTSCHLISSRRALHLQPCFLHSIDVFLFCQSSSSSGSVALQG
jgi:ankyrin repeat protein